MPEVWVGDYQILCNLTTKMWSEACSSRLQDKDQILCRKETRTKKTCIVIVSPQKQQTLLEQCICQSEEWQSCQTHKLKFKQVKTKSNERFENLNTIQIAL